MACPSERRLSLVADEKRKDAESEQYNDAIGDDSSGVSGFANIVGNEKQQLSNKLQEPEQNGNPNNGFTLVDFCDEVLYEIFKHLDSWTILALMNSAARFVHLLLDKRFWHDIDLSQKPLPLGILEDVLVRSNEGTHTIKVCGPPSGQHVAGEFKRFTTTLTSIFPKLRATLQVLELEGVSLDFSFIHITDFPASLKKLAIKDCSVKIPDDVKSIFHTMDTHLKDLDELGIEYCDWFEPYYIMAISKLPILRKLSLKGCKLLTKFVPYGSMAARFGFHKLEILDLRFTPINNADLQCFGAIESLRQLLLDCPPDKSKETEPGNETQLHADESKNNKSSQMKEASTDGNDQQHQENGDAENVPRTVDLPTGSRFYGNAPTQSMRSFGGRVFDDDNKPGTSKDRIRLLRRGTIGMSARLSGRTVDYDNMPSTSSGARSMLKRLGRCSPPDALNNGNAAKKVRKSEDSDSDSDSEVQTSKPTSNGVEDEERYSSSSPPISLSDSVKANASCFSCDSDSDVGAIEERGGDDGNDDDDDDGDDTSETRRRGARRGLLDADDTETRSTVSLSDAARDSSPTTSSTHSEASNPSVVVIRVNPHEGNSSLLTSTLGGQPNLPSRNPNAFVITAQQDRTIEEVLAHMEQIRANLRSYNQRRIARHRPYQIICMNPQNPTEPLYLMQPQNQNQRPYVCQHRQANHFEQVLGHPMFWNLMDPLNTQSSRRHRYPPTVQVSSVQVTDRAMYSFGRAPNPVEPGVIWIRNNNRPLNNRLERIELRNYRQITDLTLQHLVQVSPNLVYIDVSGTGVTRAGIRTFQERMPECEVIASHITENDLDDDESQTQSTTSTEPAQAQPQPELDSVIIPNPEERNEERQSHRIAAPIQIHLGDDDDDEDDDFAAGNIPPLEVLPIFHPIVPVNGEIVNNELPELPELAAVEVLPPDDNVAEP